jgi:hypothetical protein
MSSMWVSLFSVVLVSRDGWRPATSFNSREARRLYGLLGGAGDRRLVRRRVHQHRRAPRGYQQPAAQAAPWWCWPIAFQVGRRRKGFAIAARGG